MGSDLDGGRGYLPCPALPPQWDLTWTGGTHPAPTMVNKVKTLPSIILQMQALIIYDKLVLTTVLLIVSFC